MPVTMALIGTGQRGMYAYGPFAIDYPAQIRFVAVAEPVPERRHRFAELHAIPAGRQFASWQDLLDQPQLAEAVLVATPDRLHHDPAAAALESGYHVLIEKPMATTKRELINLVATADRADRLIQVCHVLRFTPFFQTLGSHFGSVGGNRDRVPPREFPVADHQVVALQLTSGATVTLTVQGHSHEEGRTMRYDGTRGTLRAKFGYGSTIEHHDHVTGRRSILPIPAAQSGHGGGDFGVLQSFRAAVRGDGSSITTAREVLESHLLALAAERSRLNGETIRMELFRQAD